MEDKILWAKATVNVAKSQAHKKEEEEMEKAIEERDRAIKEAMKIEKPVDAEYARLKAIQMFDEKIETIKQTAREELADADKEHKITKDELKKRKKVIWLKEQEKGE